MHSRVVPVQSHQSPGLIFSFTNCWTGVIKPACVLVLEAGIHVSGSVRGEAVACLVSNVVHFQWDALHIT